MDDEVTHLRDELDRSDAELARLRTELEAARRSAARARSTRSRKPRVEPLVWFLAALAVAAVVAVLLVAG